MPYRSTLRSHPRPAKSASSPLSVTRPLSTCSRWQAEPGEPREPPRESSTSSSVGQKGVTELASLRHRRRRNMAMGGMALDASPWPRNATPSGDRSSEVRLEASSSTRLWSVSTSWRQ